MKTILASILLILTLGLQAQIKVACVGNSITYGSGIKGRDSLAYPPQLGKILGDGWDVGNFGDSGATMLKNGNHPYWERQPFEDAKAFRPHVVVIMLGTNDSKPQNWDKLKSEYIPDYLEMIKVFKEINRDVTIYICRPIPVVASAWGIQKEVVEEEIPSLINEIAKKEGLTIIDLYTPLKDKPKLIPDKIHPDAAGSKIMSQAIADVLIADKKEILNKVRK